ncbi:UDP-sugar transporter protein SLC35A5 isoform X1 [Phycodurus eques]|uniref:UDP-sugar transporter protein SLC35A5 isoform X1 n=1 Tax=Phycodurus eques TaxID=693459 RepID=UPI002ACE470D|nr:UDP-sugar transporter protein SLC35A5 isoform X1 [Phycodurus eques]
MACQRRCPRPCSRSLAYTLALGTGFVALGTSRILLLKFSANADDKYDFLPASVNMLAEALKLLFCLVMSLRVFIRERRSCRDLRCSSASALLGSLKWAVPAFLYFLDNLIIFYVMTYLQPAMAVLFSNFVILTTAVLFRLVLKRRLSWVQWAALVILFLSTVSLTTGSGGGQTSGGSVPGVRRSPLSAPTNSCLLYTQLLEQMRNSSADDSWASRLPGRAWRDALAGKLRSLGAGHVLLLLQCFVSAAANIYNEKILKDGEQLTESIYVQNSKLYAFGVLFNGLTLAIGRESRGLAVHCGVFYGHNVYSLALVLVTGWRRPGAAGQGRHRQRLRRVVFVAHRSRACAAFSSRRRRVVPRSRARAPSAKAFLFSFGFWSDAIDAMSETHDWGDAFCFSCGQTSTRAGSLCVLGKFFFLFCFFFHLGIVGIFSLLSCWRKI